MPEFHLPKMGSQYVNFQSPRQIVPRSRSLRRGFFRHDKRLDCGLRRLYRLRRHRALVRTTTLIRPLSVLAPLRFETRRDQQSQRIFLKAIVVTAIVASNLCIPRFRCQREKVRLAQQQKGT